MLSSLSLSNIFSSLLNLAHDNTKNTDISILENRSFAIAVEELPQDIGIRIKNGKVIPLEGDQITEADVMVSGNIKSIINIIQDTNGLDNDELYITGKISTAKYFQQFLSSLTVDWQSFFTKFMPPETAKKSADALMQGIHFTKASKDQVLESLRRYLVEEKKLFVTHSEFSHLKSDISELDQRIDKILTSIDALARK